MATAKVFGDACVITSTLKYEDLKKVQKYRPEALTLYGGEDGKEPLFAISVPCEGQGKVGTYGAEFAGTSRDGQGLATITIMLDESIDDAVDAVAEAIGPQLLKISKIEEKLPAVIAEIDAEKAQIRGAISVG